MPKTKKKSPFGPKTEAGRKFAKSIGAALTPTEASRIRSRKGGVAQTPTEASRSKGKTQNILNKAAKLYESWTKSKKGKK